MGAHAHRCDKVVDIVVQINGRMEVKNVKCIMLHTDLVIKQKHKGMTTWADWGNYHTHRAIIEWFE